MEALDRNGCGMMACLDMIHTNMIQTAGMGWDGMGWVWHGEHSIGTDGIG